MDYYAFISGNHNADERLAPALQAALNRFAKPWWRRWAVHAFRGDSDPTVHPDLFGTITETLDRLPHLILGASPGATRSKWVDPFIGRGKGAVSLVVATAIIRIVRDINRGLLEIAAQPASAPSDAAPAAVPTP